MKLYQVDYDIVDVEAYKASPPTLPSYVAASNFKEAHKLASKFESENLSVREVKVSIEKFNVAIVRGFKGVESKKDGE